MRKSALSLPVGVLILALATSTVAHEPMLIERQDAASVSVLGDDDAPATFWPSKDSKLDEAEPLYTPGGQSHLAQFFLYLDARYGGAAGYLKQKLGFSETDLDSLRATLLE